MPFRPRRLLAAAVPLLLLAGPALGLELDLIEGDDDPIAEFTGALLGPSNGIEIVEGSEVFVGQVGNGEDPDTAQSATYTDLVLEHAEGGPTISNVDGILLTSGTANIAPNNTVADFSRSTGTGADADLSTILEQAGSISSVTNDVNSIEFDFTVNEGLASVSASFVFGTDEYPEFTNFTDIFAFIVDGVNYARFADGSLVSFIAQGAAENFSDNTENVYAIEYDGISRQLTVCAPLDLARDTHTIKIAIADTSDAAVDSGVLIGDLRAGTDASAEKCGFVEPADVGVHRVDDWAEAFDYWTYEVYGGEDRRTIGFLAAETAGVHVLDVTDPDRIEILGIYRPELCDDADGTEWLFYADEVTFVEAQEAIHISAGPCGVQIVDVADARGLDLEPQSFEPQLREVYAAHGAGMPGWVEAVEVRDGIAYVADYDALRIFDVSDPEDVQERSSIARTHPDFESGPVGNVVLYDDDDNERLLALVATGDGLRVVNVDDPANPYVIGEYQHNREYAISQDIALGTRTHDVLLPAWVGGLSVVNIGDTISDTGDPREVATLPPAAGVAYYTAVAYQGKIYATEGSEGLRVLDLLEPDTDQARLEPSELPPDPIEVGIAGEDWAWDVVVAGCVAYVTFGSPDTGGGGLQVTPLDDCEDPGVVDLEAGQTDDDLDGVADAEDNCLATPNADQTDSDLDGFGNACDADYDGNGWVGMSDFGVFSTAYGASSSDDRYDARVDHNADGVIGIQDFGVFSERWDKPPGPSGLVCAGSVPCP